MTSNPRDGVQDVLLGKSRPAGLRVIVSATEVGREQEPIPCLGLGFDLWLPLLKIIAPRV